MNMDFQLRDKWYLRSDFLSILHIFVAEELDQRPFLSCTPRLARCRSERLRLRTSCPLVKKPPQQDCKNDERQAVLEHELGAQCPVEKARVRWMSEPSTPSQYARNVGDTFTYAYTQSVTSLWASAFRKATE